MLGCSSKAALTPAASSSEPAAAASQAGNTSAQSTAAQTLKIGAVYPMTGVESSDTKDIIAGIQGAADAINEEGGISVGGQKYQIEIYSADDMGTPSGGVSAITRLVYDDNVKFVIGGFDPDVNMAMGKVLNEAKVMQFFTGAYVPDFVDSFSQNTFSFGGFFAMDDMYDYIFKNYPNIKTVCTWCPDQITARANGKMVIQKLEERGATVISEYYPSSTQDFSPIISQALAQKPDAFELGPGVAFWDAGITKQARQLGFTGPCFTPRALGNSQLFANLIGKEYGNDVYLMGANMSGPGITDAMQAIGERTGKNDIHVMGFEVMDILQQAIEKAQSVDPMVVKDTLSNMSSFETPYGTGKIGDTATYGCNRVLDTPFPFSKLENGEIKMISYVYPPGVTQTNQVTIVTPIPSQSTAAASAAPNTATSTGTAAESAPAGSPIEIAWDKAGDYMEKDIVVSITAQVADAMSFAPPAVIVFLGGGMGSGLAVSVQNPGIFTGNIVTEWKGKTLTVTGKVTKDPMFGSPTMEITQASQVTVK